MTVSLLDERRGGKHGPVIIEAAINGMTTPERNPNVPEGPEEIAACALRCLDAGASVIHTHNWSIELPPEEAAALYLTPGVRCSTAGPTPCCIRPSVSARPWPTSWPISSRWPAPGSCASASWIPAVST